ncbi:cell division protein SepF [Nakamurella flavida]|uniref:Cell division protein SepF n=1 Tax=Nakamurella flavida TaxID=363630 RepID=A0A938YLS4_9ACTN|nr:cell division protein SepF [Nakamurella flavida]MBM9477519.1 cell division protein SepF [Nakamurella flavida]MDP9777452.1 cell division inhibitor SepF [Nakamurella flavida]
MGSWKKVGAFLGLVPDDQRRFDGPDDGYADEYSEEYSAEYREDRADRGSRYDAPQHDGQVERPVHQNAAARGADRFGADIETQGALAVQTRPEWRREPEAAPSSARPVTVKLTGFSEARVIGEKYREGQPVILDMTEMDDAGARRLVDFAAGLAFALHGSIDKVTTKVFMLMPPDTDLSDVAAPGAIAATYAAAGR